MSSGWLESLRQGRVLLCDGAMGTMLMAAGVDAGKPGALVNVENPDVVRRIQEAYRKAGADILLTNTFQGTKYSLGGRPIVRKANEAAARIAREAGGEGCIVLGDVGPTGHFLELLGDAKFEDFKAAFSEQIAGLASEGVDGIIVETMEALEEMNAAAEAAKETARELPLLVSMTFKRDADGKAYHTMMGVGIEEAVREMTEAGADVVGSNCGNGPAEMLEVVKRISGLTDLPVLTEPNAGMPKLRDGRPAYDMGPEAMAAYVGPLLQAGASIIGGCCGTTPEHIALMAKELRKLGRRR